MEATIHGRDLFPCPELPLLVRRYEVAREVALHGHDFTELVVVAAGTAEHEVVRGRRRLLQRVAPGEVFVLAPGERHRYRPRRGFAVWNVLFTHALLAPDAAALRAVPGLSDLLATEPLFRAEHGPAPRLRLDPPRLAAVGEALAQVADEIAGARPGWRLAARASFHRALVLLARAWAEVGRPPALAAAQEEAIAAAIAFMERRHGDEDLAVADVAAAAGLSPHWFSAVFAAATGVPPWQWLTTLRIGRAQRLLAAGRLGVTAVALEVGFADPSYFARVFRAQAGCSPCVWRAQQSGGKSASHRTDVRAGPPPPR
jgi:AraC-like DNA-binding protein